MTCQVNSASALTILYLDLWDDSVLVVDERLQDVEDQFDGPIFVGQGEVVWGRNFCFVFIKKVTYFA